MRQLHLGSDYFLHLQAASVFRIGNMSSAGLVFYWHPVNVSKDVVDAVLHCWWGVTYLSCNNTITIKSPDVQHNPVVGCNKCIDRVLHVAGYYQDSHPFEKHCHTRVPKSVFLVEMEIDGLFQIFQLPKCNSCKRSIWFGHWLQRLSCIQNIQNSFKEFKITGKYRMYLGVSGDTEWCQLGNLFRHNVPGTICKRAYI